MKRITWMSFPTRLWCDRNIYLKLSLEVQYNLNKDVIFRFYWTLPWKVQVSFTFVGTFLFDINVTAYFCDIKSKQMLNIFGSSLEFINVSHFDMNGTSSRFSIGSKIHFTIKLCRGKLCGKTVKVLSDSWILPNIKSGKLNFCSDLCLSKPFNITWIKFPYKSTLRGYFPRFHKQYPSIDCIKCQSNICAQLKFLETLRQDKIGARNYRSVRP